MLIYKVTNTINNKVYIGQTVKPLSQRASEHKHRALYGNDIKNKFHNAIRKYGFNAFQWEIIEQDDNWDRTTIDEKEQYYIQKYDSINNGYNILSGGQGNTTVDRDEMSIRCGSKPFYVFNTKGILIGEFINKRRFEEEYGVPATKIVNLLAGDDVSYNGYICIDKEKYSDKILASRLKRCIIKKDFMAINMKTKEEFGPFSNIEESKRILGLPKSCHITEVLKGMRNSSNGYKFYYV